MNLPNFFAELKRRNLYKVAVAYAVVGWILVQIAFTVLPSFHTPEWVLQTLAVVVGLGFPLAVVLAWAFEMTPEGIKRAEDVPPNESITYRTGHKLTVLIIAVALIAAALLLFHFARQKSSNVATGSPTPAPTMAAAQTTPQKSIAVLPFKSLSEDKANNYFADGIQDEILARLSKIADLKVISRTSTQKYQSAPENLREIAQQLDVTNILEGSVQKSGDQVRITVQLINATTDAHLWAETYDRKLTDIFGIESEVAQRIASSLEARLSGHEKEQLAAIPTRNPQAYDAYLRGVPLLHRQSEDDVQKARDILKQAVELDPDYAQAWAQLSVAESQLYAYGVDRTQPQVERARHAAETAIRLQPHLAETRAALGGFYYNCLRDYDRALAELEEARKYSPNDATVTFYIGLVKRRQGKLDETIELLRKAAVGDPRNSDIWVNLGSSYRGMRNLHMAREMFERANAISPDELDIVGYLAETYVAEDNLDAAEKILRGRKFGVDEAFFQSVACLIYRRKFQQAAEAISAKLDETKGRPETFYAGLKGFVGLLTVAAGGEARGRPMLEQSRRELMALRENGDTSLQIVRSLMELNAALGDRKAMEHEAAGVRQQTQHDRWLAPESEYSVARAYAILGDADHALPIITQCLSVPYRQSLTPAELRLDPVWDKIRNDPRFQKLCQEKK
jgi:TolB-like protein/Tfp pilus assembly protein PilF